MPCCFVYRLQAVCSKVIQAYATYLASQRDLLVLVPAFLCHARLAERRNLARTMISTALEQAVEDSEVSDRDNSRVADAGTTK
jgi:hypothetical protein